MIQHRKHRFPDDEHSSEQDHEDEDDSENCGPVELNFLEDIKGHLEVLTFDTTLHDIFDPDFSEPLVHSPKAEDQGNQVKQPKKTRSLQNLICSISYYCDSLESSANLPTQPHSERSIQQYHDKMEELAKKLKQKTH